MARLGLFPIVRMRLMILSTIVFHYRPTQKLTFLVVLQIPERIAQRFHQEAFGSVLRVFRLRALLANSLRILLIAFFN